MNPIELLTWAFCVMLSSACIALAAAAIGLACLFVRDAWGGHI